MARNVYTLTLAPAGGARVESLHDTNRDVALTSGESVTMLADLWGTVLDRQAAMLKARTSDWRHLLARPVVVVVERPGLVLDGEDVAVEEERATIRHILRLLERDGARFGVQVRYRHLTELEAVA